MTKRQQSSMQPDVAKLDAALAQAERLIRAVRSLIHTAPLPFPTVDSGGGRPCAPLAKAERKIREAQIGILGGRPCGGGRPCVPSPLSAAVAKPSGGGRPCGIGG